MNEVLNAIQNLIQRNFDIKNMVLLRTLICTAINYIAILLTCGGISVPTLLIKMTDWKNRKAIKGIILRKINDDTLNNLIRKLCVVAIEMFGLIIGLVITGFIMSYALLFLKIRSGDISQNEGACIILVNLFVATILDYIMKKIYYKLGKALYRDFIVVIGCILGVMPIVLFVNKKFYMLFYLAMTSIVSLRLIIAVLNKKDFYKHYKNIHVRIIRLIRYILGCGCIIYIFLKLKIIETNIIFVVWMLLCLIEYIIVNGNEDNKYVDIIIHTIDGEKITKDKIIQYEGDKIKYKLTTGAEEIVNVNIVQNITYCQKHLLTKEKAGNKPILCFLNDDANSILEFQYYRMLDDTWVYFSNRDGRKRDAFIINTNKIKKMEISSKRKDFEQNAGK